MAIMVGFWVGLHHRTLCGNRCPRLCAAIFIEPDNGCVALYVDPVSTLHQNLVKDSDFASKGAGCQPDNGATACVAHHTLSGLPLHDSFRKARVLQYVRDCRLVACIVVRRQGRCCAVWWAVVTCNLYRLAGARASELQLE